MMLFGKERSRLEVVCAEFLPHRKQLFMLVADADCKLHVLQFDPDRKCGRIPMGGATLTARLQIPSRSAANACYTKVPSTPAIYLPR